MEAYTNIFKALSDKTRLRLVWVLALANRELCVCELTDALAESQYNVSRHLKELKNAGLIQDRKDGRWIFYALNPPGSEFLRCLRDLIAALPQELFREDEQRLRQRLGLRQDGVCVVGLARSDDFSRRA